MNRPVAVACLVVAFAVTRPAPARACSCAGPTVEPANGATGVPLNARVWIPDYSYAGGEMPRIVRDGLTVPADTGVIQHGSGLRLLVLTPKAALAPLTQYQVTTHATRPDANTTFTTGEASDTTPPAVPQARLTHACAALTPGSSCGEKFRLLRFHIPTDDTPIVAFTAGDEPPPPSFNQPLSSPPPPSLISLRYPAYYPGNSYSLGEGSCSGWPIPEPEGHIFYGAMDLAGNFSGWLAGGRVRLPDYPKVAVKDYDRHCVEVSPAGGDGGPPPGPKPAPRSGCQLADGGASGPGPLAILLAAFTLAWLARRPSSRRARPGATSPST